MLSPPRRCRHAGAGLFLVATRSERIYRICPFFFFSLLRRRHYAAAAPILFYADYARCRHVYATNGMFSGALFDAVRALLRGDCCREHGELSTSFID